ncbi:MAG: hypothetical protein M3022_18620 [Actinomycetota bacterium]|nr:hypothetical protein [Actinomycetota bacterium]
MATFSSVKSANRSARVAERSLLAGLRPVLTPSREDDPSERVRFGDQQILRVLGHGGAISVGGDAVYLAMALRNGGSGLAVIHGWRVKPRQNSSDERPSLEDFRRQQIDLYIPAGDTGYWLGALRDRGEPIYDIVRRAATSDVGLQVDLLYGDHEGGQRTITRFVMSEWPEDDVEGKRLFALRYWNVDRDDPR